MTDKAVNEILSRWDIIVDKLTEISPRIYEFYVRQAVFVDGLIAAVVSSIFLVLA